jgi:hypothetical protein
MIPHFVAPEPRAGESIVLDRSASRVFLLFLLIMVGWNHGPDSGLASIEPQVVPETPVDSGFCSLPKDSSSARSGSV